MQHVRKSLNLIMITGNSIFFLKVNKLLLIKINILIFFSASDHLRLSIAPDAATLISQGDSLVLETHGKDQDLAQRVVTMQSALRERFREIQNSRNSTKLLEKPQPPSYTLENQNMLREKIVHDKKFAVTSNQYQKSQLAGINSEEITSKVMKRVRDLIERDCDRTSDVNLTRHIFEIKVNIFVFKIK